MATTPPSEAAQKSISSLFTLPCSDQTRKITCFATKFLTLIIGISMIVTGFVLGSNETHLSHLRWGCILMTLGGMLFTSAACCLGRDACKKIAN